MSRIHSLLSSVSRLSLASLLCLAAGCSHSELFGTGPGADATIGTPAGVQSGDVPLTFTLSSDDLTAADVSVQYSTDGAVFLNATEGSGGDGTRNLAVSGGGVQHTFVWDTGTDLDGRRVSTVLVRIAPDSGTPATTGTFTVNNGRFLAAVERRETGRVRLYDLDVVDGGLTFRSSVDTGGTDPYDVVFESGFFLVAHEGSNNVSALELDEASSTLTLAAGSPVSGDGLNAKYVATDGDYVFVSNTGNDTITIFDFDAETGGLTLNVHSGVAAPGCESIVERSGRLYVASESVGEIIVFDIGTDGELLLNAASPVTTGGLTSPRTLVKLGTRLYAGNFAATTISGFNVLGSGGLSALAGSPFTVSSAGVEQLAALDTKLVATTGAGAALITLAVDTFGGLTEDAASPRALSGASFTVGAAGRVLAAGTTASQRMEVWTVDELGAVTPTAASPVALGVEVVRLAISD